jgi:serine/threonine protein kinase
MAPEMVSKIPHDPQLADRWSLGVLLFTMVNGHCPFRASTQKDLFVKINKGEYQYLKTVNPMAKDLISRLMAKVPHERLSAHGAMEHPWLQCE